MKFSVIVLAIVLFAAVFTVCEGKNLRKHKKTHHKTLLNAKFLLNMLTHTEAEPQPGKGVIMYEIPGHTNVKNIKPKK